MYAGCRLGFPPRYPHTVPVLANCQFYPIRFFPNRTEGPTQNRQTPDQCFTLSAKDTASVINRWLAGVVRMVLCFKLSPVSEVSRASAGSRTLALQPFSPGQR